MLNSLRYPSLFSLIFILLFSSCEAQKQKKHKKKNNQEQEASKYKNRKENNTNLWCDTSFWKYVYNPEMLEIISTCKTVTGVIEETDDNEDGDHHMLLKLDAGQENFAADYCRYFCINFLKR